METNRKSNGWQTFFEHWGFLLALVIGILTSQLFKVIKFFMGLTGAPWLWCYAIAVFLGVTSVGLLIYAKLPLYRQGRFFTFGVQELPGQRRPFYRWGYCCAVFSVVLLACLLSSRH